MPKDEIPRGQLPNIILSTLLNNDKYGYEIIDTIKQKTDGNITIKQPSLYSSLRRMEEQGLISSYWRDSEIGGRRHYYSITDYGKKYAEKWQTDLGVFSNLNNEANDTPTEKINNQNSEVKQTILQQQNLFTNQPTTKKEEQNDLIAETHSFVQFDLFTPPTLISEPSNEVFDSIKKLRESADKNQNETSYKIKTLSNLRNNTSEEIKTTYISDNHNIKVENKYNDIKKNFFELTKKQKSFAEALKDKEISNDNINCITLDESNLNTNLIFDSNVSNNNYEESSINIEELINKKEKNITSNDTENDYKFEIKGLQDNKNEIVEQKPTIFQTTKDILEPQDEYKLEIDSTSNVEFIDLNEIDNINYKNDTSSISLKEKENNNDLTNNNNTETFENRTLNLNNNTISNNEMFDKNQTPPPPAPVESKDDGVLITDKTDFSNIFKVKKIAPARFENYAKNYNDNISMKISSHLQKEKDNNISQQETITTDNTFENKQDQNNFSNLVSLKKYYSDFEIKFDTYKKQNSIHNLNYIKVNKMNFISIFVISIITLLEAIMLFFMFKSFQPNWNWLYLAFPIMELGITVFFSIKFAFNRNAVTNKNKIFNSNILYKLVIFVVSVMILFSINLLCGMSFDNILNYVTTFLYPCIMCLNFPLFYLINYILLKLKVIYIK